MTPIHQYMKAVVIARKFQFWLQEQLQLMPWRLVLTRASIELAVGQRKQTTLIVTDSLIKTN